MEFLTNNAPAFWAALDELAAASTIVIDRAKGTPHPRMSDLIYPLDYGYWEGTTAGDGQGIDVWLGSQPERAVTAIGCTVDRFKRDAEIKVMLGCTDADLRTIAHFLNEVAGLPCVIIKRAS
ncbi:MAG: hypothetical protein R3A44_42985 [Caldilineaceae bacterium]